VIENPRSAELAAWLEARGIDVHSIGVDVDERYCLVRHQDRWHVYYSERGQRSGERVFTDEVAACRALLADIPGRPRRQGATPLLGLQPEVISRPDSTVW
jgi:hypothetical protein